MYLVNISILEEQISIFHTLKVNAPVPHADYVPGEGE